MAKRKITHAERPDSHRYKDVTFIKLDCGHERSLGGHMLDGKVCKPFEMMGRHYDCVESYCSNIK